MATSRESGKFRLGALVLLALLVLAGLVGYTWHRTGRLGLWPAPVTVQERELQREQKELRAVRKRIKELRSKIAMGLPGTPREKLEEEVRELEEQAEAAEKRIARMKRQMGD